MTELVHSFPPSFLSILSFDSTFILFYFVLRLQAFTFPFSVRTERYVSLLSSLWKSITTFKHHTVVFCTNSLWCTRKHIFDLCYVKEVRHNQGKQTPFSLHEHRLSSLRSCTVQRAVETKIFVGAMHGSTVISSLAIYSFWSDYRPSAKSPSCTKPRSWRASSHSFSFPPPFSCSHDTGRSPNRLCPLSIHHRR